MKVRRMVRSCVPYDGLDFPQSAMHKRGELKRSLFTSDYMRCCLEASSLPFLATLLLLTSTTISPSTFTSAMAGKGVASAMALRHKYTYETQNLKKPPAKAATVSATAVFKNQNIDASKDMSAQPSTKKSTAKINREEHEELVHPLVLAFKDSVMFLSDGRAGTYNK